MRVWVILLVLVLSPCALAATITGGVYDLELNEMRDAVVTITTQPEQRDVAKEGTYSFTVPSGRYVIAARADVDGEEWLVEENITVASDGNYTLDLILSPSFSDVDELGTEDEDLPSVTAQGAGDGALVAFSLIGAVAAGAIGAYALHKRRKGAPSPAIPDAPELREDDDFTMQVLAALRKHDGRATQRELRQEVTFSEAKVSLVLTELEAQGRVQRIRKGRGNVVVLK